MIYWIIFLTSLSLLGYEITFTRVFSYAQWHNLSPAIITMALLGSGAAGTAATVLRKSVMKNFQYYLFFISLLYPVFMASGFFISTSLPLNPYELSFSKEQVFYISLYFLMMSLPFLAGSFLLCISFIKKPPSGAYAANLFGSGAGAALPLILSYHLHPYSMMAIMILISFIPMVIASLISEKKILISVILISCAFAPAVVLLSSTHEFRKVSQYKPVSGALNLPDAEVISEAYSPLSVIQVIEARGLRSSAGLSITSPFQVPEQRVIYFDGDSPAAITPFTGDTDSIRYITQLASWLPYYMHHPGYGKRVLIIGAGGGESILKALSADFSIIDAVELNSRVISLMKNENSLYSGNIYNLGNVTVYNDEARSFASKNNQRYDLIDIPMLDAFSSAASGVYALNESYLYTVESFIAFYRRLSPAGILSVSRWITTPPRDPLKILNTAVTALRQMNIPDPEKRVIAIRSLQTMTILISETPFTSDSIKRVRRFCDERLFDMLCYPGGSPDKAALYISERGEKLATSIASLMSHDSDRFIEAYDYDISAPADNRPYFYNFFKPAFLRYILEYGPGQVPVTEWGYLLLVLILIPVSVISFVCILFPVLILRKKEKIKSRWLIPYFSLIAAGFFFIEMPLIQKMILFLGSPVFSFSIIISSLLLFSGLGSLFSDRIFTGGRGIMKAVSIICAIMLIYAFSLDKVLQLFIHFTPSVKIALTIVLIAPPAFFMGMPFPAGLELLRDRENSLPLAWSVNGFFSVISIITAAICAVISGYGFVLITAVICYLAAGILSLNGKPN